MNPGKPTVLLAASTGVAAVDIDGTIINTALAIPKSTGDVLPAMSDQQRTQMRLSLCELKAIIIDEISMVGNTTLLHIHQRLKEIFDINNSQLLLVHKCYCSWPRLFKRWIAGINQRLNNQGLVIYASYLQFKEN